MNSSYLQPMVSKSNTKINTKKKHSKFANRCASTTGQDNRSTEGWHWAKQLRWQKGTDTNSVDLQTQPDRGETQRLSIGMRVELARIVGLQKTSIILVHGMCLLHLIQHNTCPG